MGKCLIRLVSTRKGVCAFLHVLDWSTPDLSVPVLPVKAVSADLLGGGEVKMTEANGRLVFMVPENHRAPAGTVIRIHFAGPIDEVPVVKGQE